MLSGNCDVQSIFLRDIKQGNREIRKFHIARAKIIKKVFGIKKTHK